jgi:hypothetical protein
MADINISKFTTQVLRVGSTPSSPGFAVDEGQDPVDPSGNPQTHLPVTIAAAADALSITDAQVLSGAGTTAQYIRGNGSLASFPSLTGFVPYTGATADVDLGTHDLTAERGTFANNGSSDTLTVNHTSGSGYGIIVTKGGNNEALYVSKTSGSGNAMTVIGGRTSLVDLALSSVTNTAGDFLTLSGGVVHKRTAAQTLTDIGGQAALTNPVTGTGSAGQVAYWSSGSAITGESNLFWDATNDRLGIGTNNPSFKLDIEGISVIARVFDPNTSGTNRAGGYRAQTNTSVGDFLSIANNANAPFDSNDGVYVMNRTSGSSLYFTTNNGGTEAKRLTISSTGATTIGNLAGSGTRMVVSDANGLLSTQAIPLGTVTSVTASTPLASSGGTTPNITIQQASGSQSGFLSSTDWTTFNGKQNALTNPVTGTGSAGQVAYWSSGSAITGETNLFWDATNDRLGIGISIPTNKLDVFTSNAAEVMMSLRNGTQNLTFGVNNSVGSFIFEASNAALRFGTNDTEQMRINSDGGVLIGRITQAFSPSTQGYMLSVGSAVSQAIISLAASGQTLGSGGVLFGLDSSRSFILLRENLPLAFFTNDTERMRIFSDGNVFIGSSPSNAGFKLDVNGTGRFIGDLIANNLSGTNTGNVTIATANGLSLSGQALSLGLASVSANGALSSTDWTTFNNKQNALTNPVTGTGTTNTLPKFSGSTTIANSNIRDDGTDVVIASRTSVVLSNQVIMLLPNVTGTVNRIETTGTLPLALITSGSSITLAAGGSTPQFTLNSAGNVGIGISTPLSITNNSGLQIARGGHSTLLIGNGTGHGGVVQSSDDVRRVFIGANVYDDASNSWSQFVDNSGYAAFDILGLDTFGLARILVGSPSDSGYGGGNIFFEAYKDNSNSYLKLRTNTDNALYINNSGNVLIGTTTDSGAKLQVNGDIRTGTLTGGRVAGYWKLGRAVTGTQPTNTEQIIVEINGVLYVIPAALL